MSKPTHWRITYGPGNSLTVGGATPDGNAWRKVVNDGLDAAGVSYELVGRVAAEGGLAPPWNACEGYPSHLMASGSPLDLLHDRVPGMGTADIFVIDAFTVDVASGRTVPQMIADAGALLDAVLAKASWGVVISKSLPFGTISGIPNTNMIAINAALDDIVAARAELGYRIRVSDQYTGADMESLLWSTDGVHITGTPGQAFMGANNLAAILALMAMPEVSGGMGDFPFVLGGSGVVSTAASSTSTDPPRNFLLGPDGDLVISGGQLQMVGGLESIAQDHRCALGAVQTRDPVTGQLNGEWFLDFENVGLPWFDEILVKNPNFPRIRELIRRKLLSRPGTTDVTSVVLDFDAPTRQLSIRYEALTNKGLLRRTISGVLPLQRAA